MTDQNRDLLDTPIMPTGSGVADLEIARELDALEAGQPVDDADAVPTIDDRAAAESAGHPS